MAPSKQKTPVLIALIIHLSFCTLAWGDPVEPSRILIPAVCFEMGSDVYIIEEPLHQVCLNAFFIDVTEVTQERYQKQTGLNPSKEKGATLPVTHINWSEAKIYCEKLGGRLPTEAEWEYAAGLGKESLYAWGYDMEPNLAWYKENSQGKPHPVGQKQKNALGLHDLNGNVWEWVADWFSPTYYEDALKENPTGPSEGEHKLIRGGSFKDPEGLLRTAFRYWYPPEWRSADLGFRCAYTPNNANEKGTHR